MSIGPIKKLTIENRELEDTKVKDLLLNMTYVGEMQWLI